MGREVRKVPSDWKHPKGYGEKYDPLYEGFAAALAGFKSDVESMGWKEALGYHGGGPNPDSYMPDWTIEERTHYQMYEDTSEGTPISPVMETPESLAQWLADNGASSFGRSTATYEQWLPICNGGFAPSMVVTGGSVMSGVEAMLVDKDQRNDNENK